MAAALAQGLHVPSELSAFTAVQLTGAVRRLLDRAVAAGELRGDVSAEDVLRMFVSLCYGFDAPGWQGNVLRLLDVFVDGLSCRPMDRT